MTTRIFLIPGLGALTDGISGHQLLFPSGCQYTEASALSSSPSAVTATASTGRITPSIYPLDGIIPLTAVGATGTVTTPTPVFADAWLRSAMLLIPGVGGLARPLAGVFTLPGVGTFEGSNNTYTTPPIGAAIGAVGNMTPGILPLGGNIAITGVSATGGVSNFTVSIYIAPTTAQYLVPGGGVVNDGKLIQVLFPRLGELNQYCNPNRNVDLTPLTAPGYVGALLPVGGEVNLTPAVSTGVLGNCIVLYGVDLLGTSATTTLGDISILDRSPAVVNAPGVGSIGVLAISKTIPLDMVSSTGVLGNCIALYGVDLLGTSATTTLGDISILDRSPAVVNAPGVGSIGVLAISKTIPLGMVSSTGSVASPVKSATNTLTSILATGTSGVMIAIQPIYVQSGVLNNPNWP